MEQTTASAEPKQWIPELHPSFLRHAHRRIFRLGTRCIRLCRTGWDINLVAVLHNDTATLAGQCGNAGLVEESHELHQLEQLLGRFLNEQKLPTQEQLEQIEQQCNRLITLEQREQGMDLGLGESTESPAVPEPTPSAAPDNDMQQARHPAAPGPGIPPAPDALLPRLPCDQWISPEQQPGPPANAPDTEAEPVARKATGPVLVLCQPEQLPQALVDALAEAGFSLETCPAWEEAIPLAESLDSPALLVPAGLESDPAQIKAQMARLNENRRQPVALLAVGQSTDIAERVRAMRMGAKRFFTVDSAPRDVVSQIRELTGEQHQERSRVLVVDDDASQAKFAQSILEKAGFEVEAITEPMEALKRLESFNPDLILMDLYMPEINGAELTSMIRENDRFLSTPIVFLSGEQDEERQFEALQMGGDDFLEKPIKPKHLIAAVSSRIQRSRKIRERVQVSTQASTPEDARLAMIDQLNAQLDEDNLQGKAFVYLSLKNRIAFKESLGYQHLDTAMNQLLAFLRKHAPQPCSAARFGEFSFALLCTQQERASLTPGLLQLIRNSGEFPLQKDGQDALHPQLAAGIAWLEDHPRDAARIIAQAEKAAHMAMNKEQPVHEAAPLAPQKTISKGEQQVLELIRQSLEEETLQLLFQPLINLNDNTKEQYQTLLRLMTPEQDFIPASRFIPVAEKHGMIPRLDQWVVERAMDTLSHRMRLNRPIRLFISQSVQTWLKGNMGEWLVEQLQRAAFPANLVCLEFNSNAINADLLEETGQAMTRLRQADVQICLSRFEQDREHEAQMATLKPDYIKLDPALLQDATFMQQLPETVAWAHQHQCKVIIPRVEQAMDAANFWTSGVDFLQGNFIQSPDSKLQFDFQGSAF